jgi:hypothetical protein
MVPSGFPEGIFCFLEMVAEGKIRFGEAWQPKFEGVLALKLRFMTVYVL